MRIVRIKTDCFAGLKAREYKFTDGINVLLGPNEAGKSTTIDQMYLTLFMPVNIHKTKHKDFITKYFPKGSDSFINSEIEIEDEGKHYILRKVWGDSPNESLILEDGRIIRDSKLIRDYLKDILKFNAASYKYIIFSSQKDGKDALAGIFTDDVKGELKDFIAKTVLNLGNLSLDELERKINEKLNSYASNWDIEKARPKNNRGINNPYKKEVGLVLASYYEKEYLANEAREAKVLEEDFEKITYNLKIVSENLKKIEKDYKDLKLISEDIRERELIEKSLEDLKNKEVKASEIALGWAALEQDLNRLRKNLQDSLKKEGELKLALENAKLNEKKTRLVDLLDKYKALMDKKLALESHLLKDEIEEGLILDLERKLFKKRTLEEQLNQVGFKFKLTGDKDKLKVYDAFLKPIEIDKDKYMDASSYLLFDFDGVTKLEVASPDLDKDEIKNEIIEIETFEKSVYEKFKLSDFNSLKENFIQQKKIRENISIIEKEMKFVLNGQSIETLSEQLKSLENVNEDRSIKSLENELYILNKDLTDLKIGVFDKEKILNSYKESFDNADKALAFLVELKAKRMEHENKLSTMARLPENIESPNHYFKILKDLEINLEMKRRERDKVLEEYRFKELGQKDRSFEELSIDLKRAEEDFDENLNGLNKYLKVKNAFIRVKESIENSPNDRLAQAIDKYLKHITSSNLNLSNFDDDMNFKIDSGVNKGLSSFHLSKGSKEALILSMRLALIDNLFSGRRSFVCLDDILNDLDEKRRDQAVSILKEFALKNQIIFTSAKKETADLLAGNLIEIKG